MVRENALLVLLGNVRPVYSNPLYSLRWVIRLRLQLQETRVQPFWTRWFKSGGSVPAPQGRV